MKITEYYNSGIVNSFLILTEQRILLMEVICASCTYIVHIGIGLEFFNVVHQNNNSDRGVWWDREMI
jgi:hypothetical protein